MNEVLDFLADNYKWFMGGAVVLLIALVGFIIDSKKKRKKEESVPASTVTLNQAQMPVQENVTPVAATPQSQSLVFEQPSLNENETLNEIKSESSSEPSLTNENFAESAPVDFSQQMVNVEVPVTPAPVFTEVSESVPVSNTVMDTPMTTPIMPEVVDLSATQMPETPSIEPVVPQVEIPATDQTIQTDTTNVQ